MGRSDPYPHFAVRFAAKEAVIKAVRMSAFDMKKIEITNDRRGKPLAILVLPLGPATFMISLSHTKDVAAAVAIWLH